MECYMLDAEPFDVTLSFPPVTPPVERTYHEPNPEDLIRETRCLAEFAEVRGCGFTQSTDPNEHWDALFHLDGANIAVVEFKGRNVPVMKYGGIAYFRENKVGWLIEAGEQFGVPPVILVEYTDHFFWVTPAEVIKHGELKTTRGHGRPGDPEEVEAYVVPVARLHQLRLEAETPQMESEDPPMETEEREYDWLLD